MRFLTVGTAGHIDHGKTTLVRALTGIDTDRLPEEKRRGISIELGFAHLSLTPELRAEFIDVPGHERFVATMLAGVAGIDLVLLVVAANEGVMPQTREHLAICRLLGVPRGVIVVTKADLVEPDLLPLVVEEVRELAGGTFLADAPAVSVSAATGQGLADLRQALIDQAALVPGRSATGIFRLPVDRVFQRTGFGTVVTGTVWDGTVQVNWEVEADGQPLRVRGLQVHGQAVESASAGQRVAINLASVEAAALPRGTVLTEPQLLRPVSRIGAELELLAGAKPLRSRAIVRFHAGTAEVGAEVRLRPGTNEVRPGERVSVRMALAEPLLLVPGDRFVLRLPAPVATLGGGVVTVLEPRRGEAELSASATLAGRIAHVAAHHPQGLAVSEAGWRCGVRVGAIRTALPQWVVAHDWLLSPERQTIVRRELIGMVKAHHRAQPTQPGLPREAARTRLLPNAPPAVFDALLTATPELTATGEHLRHREHHLALDDQQSHALQQLERVFQTAGYAVPDVGAALAQVKLPAAQAKALLHLLYRQGKLVRVGAGLVFHRDALQQLRGALAARKGTRFTVPQFKEWTGISRKYAIPLLEHLDRERVTRREGDVRVVL